MLILFYCCGALWHGPKEGKTVEVNVLMFRCNSCFLRRRYYGDRPARHYIHLDTGCLNKAATVFASSPEQERCLLTNLQLTHGSALRAAVREYRSSSYARHLLIIGRAIYHGMHVYERNGRDVEVEIVRGGPHADDDVDEGGSDTTSHGDRNDPHSIDLPYEERGLIQYSTAATAEVPDSILLLPQQDFREQNLKSRREEALRTLEAGASEYIRYNSQIFGTETSILPRESIMPYLDDPLYRKMWSARPGSETELAAFTTQHYCSKDIVVDLNTIGIDFLIQNRTGEVSQPMNHMFDGRFFFRLIFWAWS